MNRCPRCNAPEDRHNDTCPIHVANLEQIAVDECYPYAYRLQVRRELRSIKAAIRREKTGRVR